MTNFCNLYISLFTYIHPVPTKRDTCTMVCVCVCVCVWWSAYCKDEFWVDTEEDLSLLLTVPGIHGICGRCVLYREGEEGREREGRRERRWERKEEGRKC